MLRRWHECRADTSPRRTGVGAKMSVICRGSFSPSHRSSTGTVRFAVFCLVFCLPALAYGEKPASVSHAAPQQVQQTVGRAIGYLQTESAAWLQTRKCAACHHAAMPLWALSQASQQGYSIDRKFLVDTAEATLGSQQKMIAAKLVSDPAAPPDTRPSAKGVNMGTVFMAVAAESFPVLEKGQAQSLKQIADDIVQKQREDGSWEFFANLSARRSTKARQPTLPGSFWRCRGKQDATHRNRCVRHWRRGPYGWQARSGLTIFRIKFSISCWRYVPASRRRNCRSSSTDCSPGNDPTAVGARPRLWPAMHSRQGRLSTFSRSPVLQPNDPRSREPSISS